MTQEAILLIQYDPPSARGWQCPAIHAGAFLAGLRAGQPDGSLQAHKLNRQSLRHAVIVLNIAVKKCRIWFFTSALRAKTWGQGFSAARPDSCVQVISLELAECNTEETPKPPSDLATQPAKSQPNIDPQQKQQTRDKSPSRSPPYIF